ncbi:MAG: undecaprenyldiphospho-muramoylpentapeptide beta-N-acetylglucosaminyltransferase [Syntrophobacterales bacterium CG_4_8_14_3_um_filter_49_14]|nr:MAG: undecaprenyldiphospho-muramoylpentapeptide beta-N-acetylglucosaminyltransferase [Syntrophobacterales bacterium CG23_combo_of_CG06-09_8_20_14_all_48_27]PJC73884.1 MAG: undecaprenyldiphospho-muramoylpentapeptide beta-N-acetylglucosaminyltransferase [Syntrophobacterales bacterium CG_4_8_14_3_um_filter_49_14]
MGTVVKVIIAGGGTGGHLFPGIAIAEEFQKRGQKNIVLFIGTDRGLEKKALREMGFPLRTLDVEGIKGKGFVERGRALLKIPRSLLRSFKIIREFRPDIVIGVGGYASGPAVITAHFMGVKTAVAEQNVLPGITNRVLGRFVDKVFLTFSETRKWFPEKKVLVTGNPIRAAFFSGIRDQGSEVGGQGSGVRGQGEGRREKGENFTILVFGGSQGAHVINVALINAVGHLKDMRERLRIIHQTGYNDLEEASEVYHVKGIAAEVFPFIMDMASAFRKADLLICRAGATTVAEITAMGKTAILIPFPFATGDHQTKNAEVLVKAGAAEMIPEKELEGKRLAEVIRRFHRQPEMVREMEIKSAGLGNVRAATDIVDACMAMVKGLR